MKVLVKQSTTAVGLVLTIFLWSARGAAGPPACDFGDFQQRAVAAVSGFVASPSDADVAQLRGLATEGEQCIPGLTDFQAFVAHYLTGYIWYSIGISSGDVMALRRAETHFRSAVQTYDDSFGRPEMLQVARLMVGWAQARQGDLSGDISALGHAATVLGDVADPLRVDAKFLRGLIHLRIAEILFQAFLSGSVGAPLDSAVVELEAALGDLGQVQQNAQEAALRASAAYWAGEAQLLRIKVQATRALEGKGTLSEQVLANLSGNFDHLAQDQKLDVPTRRASQLASVYSQMASAVVRLNQQLRVDSPQKIDLNTVGTAANPSDFCASLPVSEVTNCQITFAALFGLRPGFSLEQATGALVFWRDWAKLHNFMVFGNVWDLGLPVPNLASWFEGTDGNVQLTDLFVEPSLPGVHGLLATEYLWARAVVRASLGKPVVNLPNTPSRLWPPEIAPTLENVSALASVASEPTNLIAPPSPLPNLAAPEKVRESVRMCMTLGGLLGRRWYRYAFFLLQYPQAQDAFGSLRPILSELTRYLGAGRDLRSTLAGFSHQELWRLYTHGRNQNIRFAALSALAVIHFFEADLCDSGPGQEVASACRQRAGESPLFAYTGQYFCNVSDLNSGLLQVARCQVSHFPDLGYQWWNFKVPGGPSAATCDSPVEVPNEYRADWWIPEFSHLSPSRRLYISLRHKLGMLWLSFSPAPGMPSFWRPQLLTGLRTPGPAEFRVQARIPVALELGSPGLRKRVVLTMNGEAVVNETSTEASVSLQCYSGQEYGLLVWADGFWPHFERVHFSVPGELKHVRLTRAPETEPTQVRTYENDDFGRLPLWWDGTTTLWMTEGGYAYKFGEKVFQPRGDQLGAVTRAVTFNGQTFLLDASRNQLVRSGDGHVFPIPRDLGNVLDLAGSQDGIYVLGDSGKLAILAGPELAPRLILNVPNTSVSICRLPAATWVGDLDGPAVWMLQENGGKIPLVGLNAAVTNGLVAPSRIIYNEDSGYVGIVDLLSRRLFFFLPNGEYVGLVNLPAELDWDWVSWELGKDGLTLRFGVPGALREAQYPARGQYVFEPAGDYTVPEQPVQIPQGGWIVVRLSW